MRKYHSAKDYLDAAKSPDTPLSELEYLATSEYDFVRIAVAENPGVSSEILAALVPEEVKSWNEQALASNLAAHPKTPADALESLAGKLVPVLDHGRGNDNGFRAGVNLCCNPTTPLGSIQKILDPDKVATHFRKVVARETRREDVLNLLMSDRSEAVRKRARKSLEELNRGGADMPTRV